MDARFNPPEAIIFDMDGLMLNSEVIFHEAWQSTLVALGYGPLDDDAYRQLVGCSNDLAEKKLCHWLGADFPLELFRIGWITRWQALAAKGIPTQPGLWSLLEWLEALGLPKAVGTASGDREAQVSLKSTGLWPRFETIVTVDQAGAGKPAPDIFLMAASRLARRPSKCLVLEDSNVGVQAAVAAGMAVIMVPDLQTPTAFSERHALTIVPSLHDVLAYLQARGPWGGQ